MLKQVLTLAFYFFCRCTSLRYQGIKYRFIFKNICAGSGKTAAFLVPILSQIYANGPVTGSTPGSVPVSTLELIVC